MYITRPTLGGLRRFAVGASLSVAAFLSNAALAQENITIFHIGDQETWLLSAQGNLRDNATQTISFYGGIDRLAQVLDNAEAAAQTAGRFVLKLNAGDAILPGPRFVASEVNLATAYNGGQDYYDAIALRQMDFDAVVFGNHEFDLGVDTAARFADVSETSYLSINLDFSQDAELATLQTAGKVGASKIVETPGGNRIGIIGVTTPLLPTISSPQTLALMQGFAGFSSTNTEAQNLNALLPVIQAEIDDLRATESVDVIILLSHLQNSNNERNILVPGLRHVDLVVSGGGHELMTDPDDLLISGGVAPTYITHPITANDLDSQPVPIVTGHFGNRYLGELNATIGTNPGDFTITSTRMIRVSGRATDTDSVTGDATLFANVVTPVLNFINALNSQVIATTATILNGPTHVAGTPGNYTEGVRNAETGLGNLVADAMRFAGEAEVAIQNAGGIRVSITSAGNLTVGDTFNILPFTNIVKRAPVMNATQLKDILEHAYLQTTPSGDHNGRYAQVSGIRVEYDSTRTARTSGSDSATNVAQVGTGDKVRRIVLDDGTVLVDNGVVVNNTRTFSFATIDFLANGGDGYPFIANNVVFENSTFSITYQEALKEFLETPKSLGGLQRVSATEGDEVTNNVYGVENAFDTHGRIVDLAVAVATPGVAVPGNNARNTLVGDGDDNTITGGFLSDTLTGGAGGDTFVYSNLRDAGDTIIDFTPYADKIQITQAFLTSIGYAGSDPIEDGVIVVADVIGGISLQYDSDGSAGPRLPRGFAVLRGLVAHQFSLARDVIVP